MNTFCRILRLSVSIYAATISLLLSNVGNGLHGVWRVLVVGLVMGRRSKIEAIYHYEFTCRHDYTLLKLLYSTFRVMCSASVSFSILNTPCR